MGVGEEPQDLENRKSKAIIIIVNELLSSYVHRLDSLHPRGFYATCTSSLHKRSFLPCDALRCTVSVIVILSVCLSVRLSVTLVDCVHTVRPTIMISSPHGSPIILVSGGIKFIPKFEGDHPVQGR